MGVNDAYNILQTGLNEAQIASNLNHLNARAVDISIGFGADGTPLRSLLDDSYGKATNGLLQELTDGLAKGLNPVTIARNMADGFGEPILQRALVIARTETLRAYRMGSQEQYKESGIVTQYKRLATKDDRTCLGCLMQDGEIYDTVDAFEEHPNGRCTLVPIIDGVTPPDWQSGKDWLAGLPEDRQREIMGDKRFELYKNGTPLEDMSKHVDNATWGGSFVPTPVGELDK
jgi:SPP1 gp7 family putative phage head morphogenesis protein